MNQLLLTTGLYLLTAVAEIVGCYLPWLWLNQRAPVWVLLPAALSLALVGGRRAPAAVGLGGRRSGAGRHGRHGAGAAHTGLSAAPPAYLVQAEKWLLPLDMHW